MVNVLYMSSYLGVLIDSNLSWNFHIDELRKKLNRTDLKYTISHVRPFLRQYNTLFNTILSERA